MRWLAESWTSSASSTAMVQTATTLTIFTVTENKTNKSKHSDGQIIWCAYNFVITNKTLMNSCQREIKCAVSFFSGITNLLKGLKYRKIQKET